MKPLKKISYKVFLGQATRTYCRANKAKSSQGASNFDKLMDGTRQALAKANSESSKDGLNQAKKGGVSCGTSFRGTVGRTRDYTVLHPSYLSVCNVTIQDTMERSMDEFTTATPADLGEAGRLRKKADIATSKTTTRFRPSNTKSKKDVKLEFFGFEDHDETGGDEGGSGSSNYKIKYFGFDDLSESEEDDDDDCQMERKKDKKRTKTTPSLSLQPPPESSDNSQDSQPSTNNAENVDFTEDLPGVPESVKKPINKQGDKSKKNTRKIFSGPKRVGPHGRLLALCLQVRGGYGTEVIKDLRVSIITFSCKGNIILPITGDREEILKGIERLKYSIPAGHELLYLGLWKANKQIRKVNSGDVQRPSMIISLLHSPLYDDIYKFSMEEADDARKMGVSVYCVGVGDSDKNQILEIAGKPENAFIEKKAEHLNDLIFPIASKACPSLQASDTRIICIRESNPVILRGYGFDFAVHKEEVICRFHFHDMDKSFEDVKARNLTKTTVTCPGPIVDEPGKVIYVLLSLDNGRNFLNNNNAFIASKLCGKEPFTTTTTTTRRPTTKTTRTTTTTTTSTTTTTPATTTTPTTTTATATTSRTTTESPTTIPLVTKELKPSGDIFIFAPILLGLLLTLLLIGCLWQLCCLPPVEEPPPPKPQPQPRKKQQPPPPVSPPEPAPPVNPSPVVIVCCCTCHDLPVSRDMEGNVTVCNFNPLSCHQLPLMCPHSGDQGQCTNFALGKTLCAQDSCSPRVSLPPSQECLPLASCSQCHQFPVSCSRFPSRLPSATPPFCVPRARISMYCTSQMPQCQD